MADLIDRISGEAADRPKFKLNSHRFIGVQRLYAFGEVSRAEIVAEFDLQGDEVTQAGALADNIDAETGISDKALYILRVESVCMCLEDGNDTLFHTGGTVDKSAVLAALQIS